MEFLPSGPLEDPITSQEMEALLKLVYKQKEDIFALMQERFAIQSEIKCITKTFIAFSPKSQRIEHQTFKTQLECLVSNVDDVSGKLLDAFTEHVFETPYEESLDDIAQNDVSYICKIYTILDFYEARMDQEQESIDLLLQGNPALPETLLNVATGAPVSEFTSKLEQFFQINSEGQPLTPINDQQEPIPAQTAYEVPMVAAVISYDDRATCNNQNGTILGNMPAPLDAIKSTYKLERHLVDTDHNRLLSRQVLTKGVLDIEKVPDGALNKLIDVKAFDEQAFDLHSKNQHKLVLHEEDTNSTDITLDIKERNEAFLFGHLESEKIGLPHQLLANYVALPNDQKFIEVQINYANELQKKSSLSIEYSSRVRITFLREIFDPGI